MNPTRRDDETRAGAPRALEREARYQTFVRQSSDGIWCCEIEEPIPVDLPEVELIDALYRYGFLAECNDAMARMYGFERAEDLYGARIAEMLVREDPRNVEFLRAFIRSGFRLENAGTVERDRDGNPRYFVNSLVGVVAGGRLERVWGTQRDVTEQRRVEDALRESEQRYRELFESANDVVYTHDLEGRFTSLNRAGERVTGYTREEAASMRIEDVLDPEQADLARSMVARKVAGQRETTYELQIVAKDGRRVPVEVSTQLVLRDGRPVEVLGIARDVSERRRLEGQLLQSQKMEAVGRLAGGVAHDFNNLLTIINGYTELLLKRLDASDPLHADAAEVARAGQRAAVLTRQLLTFGRSQMVAPKPIDLNAVVADVDTMLRRLIGEDVELDVRLDPSLGVVRADPGQIEQLVVNLAVNARDAMPKGGRLAIETSDVVVDAAAAHRAGGLAPGRYALLVVADTGEGMDAETQARIFEPFFTTKAPGKGTGLGLATVYGIVKQSGGHVAVESRPGEGATFKVYLPAAEPPAERPALGGRGAPMRQGSETILLVEDEEIVRRLVCDTLELCGYKVMSASGGADALRLCDEFGGTIHLLLTDVMMPGMNGVELRKRVTARRPDVRVLYMSGYNENLALRDGGADAEAAFLAKPFAPEALADKVREVLD